MTDIQRSSTLSTELPYNSWPPDGPRDRTGVSIFFASLTLHVIKMYYMLPKLPECLTGSTESGLREVSGLKVVISMHGWSMIGFWKEADRH